MKITASWDMTPFRFVLRANVTFQRYTGCCEYMGSSLLSETLLPDENLHGVIPQKVVRMNAR